MDKEECTVTKICNGAHSLIKNGVNPLIHSGLRNHVFPGLFFYAHRRLAGLNFCPESALIARKWAIFLKNQAFFTLLRSDVSSEK